MRDVEHRPAAGFGPAGSPLGQLSLERVAEDGVRAFAATGQDFGEFDFSIQHCTAGGLFYRGRYSGGQVLACGEGSRLYGQYRSDAPENPPTSPGAPLRSGFFSIGTEGSPPALRFTGEITQYLAGVPTNTWGGACTGAVCTGPVGAQPTPTPTTPATVPPRLSCDSAAVFEGPAPPRTFCGLKPLRDNVRDGAEGNVATAEGGVIAACGLLIAAGLFEGLTVPATAGASTPAVATHITWLGGACVAAILAYTGARARVEIDDVVRAQTGKPKIEDQVGSRGGAVAADAHRIFLPRPRPAGGGASAKACSKVAGRAPCARLAALSRQAVSASGAAASLAEALAVSSRRALRAASVDDAEGAVLQQAVANVYAGALAEALASQQRATAALAGLLRSRGLDVRLTRAQVTAVADHISRLRGIPPAALARLRSDGFSDAQIREAFRNFEAPSGPLTLSGALSKAPSTAGLSTAPDSITPGQVGVIVRALTTQRAIPAGLDTTLLADVDRLSAAPTSGRAAAARRLADDAAKVAGRYGLLLRLAVEPLAPAGSG